MDARQVISAALEALSRGDLAEHLSYVDDDLMSSLVPLPTRRGKAAYGELLSILIRSNESAMDYRIERLVELPGGSVKVEVAELRPIPRPPRSSHPEAFWFRSTYVVEDQVISEAMIETLGTPKRSASYS
jgi:ketosteroid isomerase-like protein